MTRRDDTFGFLAAALILIAALTSPLWGWALVLALTGGTR